MVWPVPLFSCFVAEIEDDSTDNKEANCGISLYYYRFSTWKGKNNPFRRFSGKREYAWLGWAILCILKF
jgi:hypothetical protein